MAHFPWLFLSPCWFPFVSPLYPLLLTWHPPAVTGIVHLRLRLLVNWPHLPTLHPTVPPFPNSQNPNCPAPNNDDLGNIPALAIRNTIYLSINQCCRTSCLACFHSGDPDQVVPFALYTVLLYTHAHTHTLAVLSASHSLFRLRKSFFVLNSAVYTPLATTFTALFTCDFI
jgi:hypothetical protein